MTMDGVLCHGGLGHSRCLQGGAWARREGCLPHCLSCRMCAENTGPWESVAEGGEAYETMRAGGLCVECRWSQIVGVHEGCPESW